MTRKYVYSFLIGAGIFAVLYALLASGFFRTWQLELSDKLFLPEPPHPDIAIIAIDDGSIQAIGRWPWDRTVHAKLLGALGDAPAAIGLDVAFPEESSRESDDALALAFKQSGRVVIPIEANSILPKGGNVVIRDYLMPVPRFAAVTTAGVVNMVTDTDGITRLSPLVVQTDDGTAYENFSLQLLSRYYRYRGTAVPRDIPAESGLLRIHFIGSPGSFPTYSFRDVLDGNVGTDAFRGKIVLIGSTALDLHDSLLTPVSSGRPMSGVEVHANVIQTILDRKFLYPEHPLVTVGTIAGVVVAASFLFACFGIFADIAILFLGLGVYLVYGILSFDAGIIRNLIFPPLALILVFIGQVMFKYFVENKQRRFIRKAFSYYISESVLKDVLGNPKKLMLGGVRKEITVLFSDIAGFTSISEKLAPETLSTFLNQYLTRMTKIVFAHQGVLDKYIGDAVMAFWGAPLPQKEHALLACRAAIEMQEEIGRMKEEWKKIKIEFFDVRIGINTGDMVVGNMGSDLRFDYTLLGDNVNLGSRLEGINKEYGTHIIISQSTYDQVKDQVTARRIDTVAVLGKARGVTIYELRGLGAPAPEEKRFLEAFEDARGLYHAGKFRDALKEFEYVYKTFPHDMPTKVYIQRCKELIRHPAAGWDGVYHAQFK